MQCIPPAMRTNILIFKAQNWLSLLIAQPRCTILSHPRISTRNPSFIYMSLSATQHYLKAYSQSPWAKLQFRLHMHQTSPELLAAAELKLLVEASTESDKNPFTLLICHQRTTYSKTEMLQDCTC